MSDNKNNEINLEDYQEKLDSHQVYDDADLASIMERNRVAAALAEHKKKMEADNIHPDFDGIHCIVCDEEIPELRRKGGKIRCVPCQSALESKRARGLI